MAQDTHSEIDIAAVADAVAADHDADESPAVAADAPASRPRKGAKARKPVFENTSEPVAAAPVSDTETKDTIMDTTTTTATDYAGKAKELAADLQTRAKDAFEKGSEMSREAVAFQKGNFEAMMQAAQILATGMQDMGRTYADEARAAAETAQDDVKRMAAVTSPTDLFQLQGEIARRNLDAMVSASAKTTEAMMKLANEAFAPVSTRMSLAADRMVAA